MRDKPDKRVSLTDKTTTWETAHAWVFLITHGISTGTVSKYQSKIYREREREKENNDPTEN